MEKRDQVVLAALVIGLLVGAAATYALAGASLGRTTTTTVASPPTISTVTTTSTTVSTTSIVSVSTVTAAKSAAFALSVGVDRPDYTTNQLILVNGSVSPTPNFPLNVTLIVTSPLGVIAIASSPVSNTNGSYSYTLRAGAAGWVVGVYGVSAVCVDFGATGTATTQFTYEVPV